MVKETGEGTSRFLHSVVKGEIDAREGQSSQAQRAKDKVGALEAPVENCKDVALSLVRPHTAQVIFIKLDQLPLLYAFLQLVTVSLFSIQRTYRT